VLDIVGSGFAAGSDTGLMVVGAGFEVVAARAAVAAELTLYFWKSSSCVNAKRSSSLMM
jgi:hypothetical protein